MKIDKILIKLGWFSELLMTIILINFGYFFIFTYLEKPDKILIIAVLLLMFIVNLTKIPMATAFIFSESFFYRLIFLIALVLIMIVSFETYFQIFEFYLVNNIYIDQLIEVNQLMYLFLSFMCAMIGVMFALPGLFLARLKQNKEIKKYNVKIKNG